MYNNKIQLYIGGTKSSQAGFSDLVILGLFPKEEFENMDRATLISEKPVYIVKQAKDYILYQLIDRKVKSFDAERNGVLSIAIAIPANMQFAAGQSPYTLLTDVYRKFRSNFMTPYGDGRDSFLDIPADEDVFKQITDSYSLELRTGKYVAMGNGITGTLSVPQDKMEEFFRDTQYNEFSAFKDIEIGTMCQSSPGLETLVIPRPVSYRVYVNDQLSPEELCIKDKPITTNLPNGENICFTLAQLETAPGFTIKSGKSEVRLDKANERIVCRIAYKDILYRCCISVKGSASQRNKEEVRSAILNGLIKITETHAGFDIMDYHRESLNFEILSSKMISKTFTLDKMEYNGMKLAILSDSNPQAQTINISIDVTEAEPTMSIRAGKKDRNPQVSAAKRAKGNNNQPDDSGYDEAKLWEEVNKAVRKREEELNAEWKELMKVSNRKFTLGGLVAGFVICLLVFLLSDKEPELDNAGKEKILKEMLTDVKKKEIFDELLTDEKKNEILDELLTDEKKEEIFKEFINKEGFYDSKLAKKVAEEYNNKNKRNNPISNARARQNTPKPSDTGTANAKEEAHAWALELVKAKDLNGFRKKIKEKNVKQLFTEQEINAIEAILDYKRKYGYGPVKNAVKTNVYDKVFDGREITWELLEKARKRIEKIESNQKNQLTLTENLPPL